MNTDPARRSNILPIGVRIALIAAKVGTMRFDRPDIGRLPRVTCRDWPADKIGRNLDAIRGANITLPEAAV